MGWEQTGIQESLGLVQSHSFSKSEISGWCDLGTLQRCPLDGSCSSCVRYVLLDGDPRGRPRTRSGDSISHLAWGSLRSLESVAGIRVVWNDPVNLLPLWDPRGNVEREEWNYRCLWWPQIPTSRTFVNGMDTNWRFEPFTFWNNLLIIETITRLLIGLSWCKVGHFLG